MKQPYIIPLPKIIDKRGNLSFVEENNHIPFPIKRSYWIYDVPGGEKRGGHAYRENEEFIIALSGSFDVVLDDGREKYTFTLNRSYYGLYVPKMIWRQMENFSTNSLALVLASTEYSPDDYIHNYYHFLEECSNEIPQICDKQPAKSVENITNGCITSVFNCHILELEKNHQVKGNITVIENQHNIPFDVRRAYYLYDIPGGETRGGHAHKELQQLILAVSGSFTIVLDDGINRKRVFLNRPYHGLLIPPGIWRELEDFSSGAVCLVLASHIYDEADYIRKYEDFVSYKKKK